MQQIWYQVDQLQDLNLLQSITSLGFDLIEITRIGLKMIEDICFLLKCKIINYDTHVV